MIFYKGVFMEITVKKAKVTPFKLSKAAPFKLKALPKKPALKTTASKAALKLPKVEVYQPKTNIPVRWL